jgi:hypothetical protein
MTLLAVLPVPLLLAVPVNVRFSKLLASVMVAELKTVSVPALAASIRVSPPSVM